jgi:hypothetical protein
MFMQVDLPEPLGPMTATNSPGAIARSMPRSARTSPSPSPYTFVTCDSSITWRGGVGMPVISWALLRRR